MNEQDRIVGTMLAMAAGDALGAGYEFKTGPFGDVEMIGGGLGNFAPGEWTDDTSMAICIAEVTSRGSVDLEAIADRFLTWARSGPADIGISTQAVLGRARDASDVAHVAAAYFADHPKGAAGNGALMRTAPVALAHLGDDRTLAQAARQVAALTHADPLAGDSCVLWCIAIERAIRDGRLDGIRDGLDLLPEERRRYWSDAIDAAEHDPPATFQRNGFTVTALQAAYAAVIQTPVQADAPARHLQDALDAAVRIGHDTDTVAAIAGALLGARWGASAVPSRWRRMLHGWPGLQARDLVPLAVLTASRGRPSSNGWPIAPTIPGAGDPAYIVPLPDDPGLVLGNMTSLSDAVEQVDAVVSLCRVGTEQVPADVLHHEVWLVDRPEESANRNLSFVIEDTVETLVALRDEGKRVFLHCAGGRSRTPMIAAAYLVERQGVSAEEALERVAAAIPVHDRHNHAFLDELEQYAARLENHR